MPVTEGRGSPGAAVPEVLTVQGVVGGVAVPVSGAAAGTNDEGTFTPGTTPGMIAQFVVDETATDTVAEGNYGAGRMTGSREPLVAVSDSRKTFKSASFSLNATGTVVSAVASKRIKVFVSKVVVSAAISVNWRSGASTDLEGAMPFAANGGSIECVDPPAFLFGTAAGERLDLVISGAGTAAGRVSYWDDDSA